MKWRFHAVAANWNGRSLIIADEAMMRDTLGLKRRAEDHEILTAANGVNSLRLARVAGPDRVILDLLLLALDGLTLCRAVRRDFNSSAIMLTSGATKTGKIARLETDIHDGLVKPVNWTSCSPR
jgi:two-component system, OmpR family, response regulator VanR